MECTCTGASQLLCKRMRVLPQRAASDPGIPQARRSQPHCCLPV